MAILRSLAAVFGVATSLLAASPDLPKAPGKPEIRKVEKLSPKDAEPLLKDKGVVLIDVREPVEWEQGTLPEAKLLSLSDLKKGSKGWKEFLSSLTEEHHLLLYCRSGARSALAASVLAENGYHVSNVGGYGEWLEVRSKK